MPFSLRLSALCVALAFAAPAGAQLYKWTDENGTVNYSNKPPEKTKGGKPATIVEDRTSVYTPEKSVTDALDRSRLAPAPQPQPQPSVASVPQGGGGVIGVPPPPPPPAGYDPCRVPGDPNCQTVIYDNSPAFAGRRRPPPLVQPQLPPGTIAGQSTGGGVIPGLSGVTPPAPQVQRPLSPRERDRELERYRERPR